jgi:carbon-monoxide dehydrogenase large subunit
MTLWSTTQIPHLLRTQLAIGLGLPEHSVRVIAPEVGGGFGSKLNVYAEEFLAAHLAKTLGRPVKWTADRSEGFLATTHGRDQLNEVEVGVDGEGHLLGMRVRMLQDLGAYHQLLTPVVPTLTVLMLPGCYRLPNLEVHLSGVFTNKTPTDAYRGAGRPEATFLIERVMDHIAAELDLDPAEVRRRNFIAADDFPATTATELVYDSGDYETALDRLLEVTDYAGLRREQEERRARGEVMGIGLSTYVEICGIGPSAALPAGGWEACTVEVRRSLRSWPTAWGFRSTRSRSRTATPITFRKGSEPSAHAAWRSVARRSRWPWTPSGPRPRNSPPTCLRRTKRTSSTRATGSKSRERPTGSWPWRT